jgi:amino acid adenylation domain-containing protein
MFHSAARAHPDLNAVVCDDKAITYADLDRWAREVTGWLVSTGVRLGDRIGICMERSPEMVVALLATLGAGAVFVPMDTRWPVSRLCAIAQASTATVILVDPDLPAAPRLSGARSVPSASRMSEPAPDPAPARGSLNAPAYIYFTSGSTGESKGVVIDHRSFAGRIRTLQRRFPLAPGDWVAAKTPLSFDVAVWEIFGPLSVGATIRLVRPRGETDVDHLRTVLGDPRVVCAHFVPSMLAAYLRHAEPANYPGLRWVWTSGEAVTGSLLERFDRHFPPEVEFHNLYGQTETSEVAAWSGRRHAGRLVPLGRQLGEYRLFVLDDQFRLAPAEVTGELCIAGVGGLALGYLNRPGLTAERFVPHPYPIVPGELIYRTGDLASVDVDGVLAFHGRADRQVKVWGCRVELGEVEAALGRCPGVQDCVVVTGVDKVGDTELVAYVVGVHLSPRQLRAHLSEHLPWYMVPGAYMHLDALPLLPSGKVDNAALPEPDHGAYAGDSGAARPTTALQRTLAAAWCDVLGVREAAPEDDFFAIGGTSLKAVAYLHRVREQTGVRVPHGTFLVTPTIAGLERAIRTSEHGSPDGVA